MPLPCQLPPLSHQHGHHHRNSLADMQDLMMTELLPSGLASCGSLVHFPDAMAPHVQVGHTRTKNPFTEVRVQVAIARRRALCSQDTGAWKLVLRVGGWKGR